MKSTLALLFLLCPTPCTADPGAEAHAELSRIRDDVATVQRLHSTEGFFTGAETTDFVTRKLAQARKVVGRPVTTVELEELVKAGRNVDRLRGLRDKVVFLAGVFLVVSLAGLALFYLGPVLRSVPYAVYEVLAWTACFAGLLSQRLWPATDFWLVIPGALAVLPCFLLTKTLHFPELRTPGETIKAGSVACTVLWGFFAILYQSQFLGFLAVAAFETRLGFSVLAMPLCYAIGFSDREVIPRSMGASFLMLASYVVVVATGADFGGFEVFKAGMLKVGAFVYFTGCLIVSNRYYRRAAHNGGVDAEYFLLQLLTIGSGAAALYLGALLGIPALSGIGGTFFALYLVEKYMEIPWQKVGWAWGLLGLSLGLYYLAGFATTHPRYFVAW